MSYEQLPTRNPLCTGFPFSGASARWVWLEPMGTHFADLAMVSVLGLLLKTLPLLQHLGVGEGNPIDPLQSLHIGAALPVGGGVLMAERRNVNKTIEELYTGKSSLGAKTTLNSDTNSIIFHRYLRTGLCTYLVDLHGLDLASVPDMGTSAQVDQGPASNQDSYNYTTVHFKDPNRTQASSRNNITL